MSSRVALVMLDSLWSADDVCEKTSTRCYFLCVCASLTDRFGYTCESLIDNQQSCVIFNSCFVYSGARSLGRSIDRSIARSLDRSVARSLTRSIARSLGRSVARSLDRSVARSLVRSLDRSISLSLDRSLDRSIVPLFDRLDGASPQKIHPR